MTNDLIEFDLRRTRSATGAAGANSESFSSTGVGSSPSIRHILVPFDGSTLAENIAPFVNLACRAFGARVTVLRVLESTDATVTQPVDALEWEMARAEAYANLTAFAAQLGASGCPAAAVEILQGSAAEQIAHFAARAAVDLIVMSSHGAGGLHGWRLASTAHKIVDTTPASVLIVPSHRRRLDAGADAVRRILVPLDCSQRAESVLPMASELARVQQAELLLAHIVAEPELPRRLAPSREDVQLAAKLTDRNRREARQYLLEVQSRLANANAKVDTRLVVSSRLRDALQQILQEDQIDLVVCCAHGRSGDARQRYGALAASLVYESDVPVLVLQDLPQSAPAPTSGSSAERPGH